MSTQEVRLKVLTRIYEQHGELTPALVVEEARNPASEIHEDIPWDDAEAANQYRLQVAAELIRSVKIKITEPELAEVRGFVHVETPDRGPGRYAPVEDVGRDPALRQIALRQMERDWKVMRRRYEVYAEFWTLIGEDVSGQERADTG